MNTLGKTTSVLVILLLGIVQVFAQNNKITVRGMLTDDQNEPIIGASILEKNTTNGTISDIDGKYEIIVAADAVLRFSFIGMETVNVKVKGKNTIDVQLKDSGIMLDEVVAIGYGTVKRSELTSAVSSVRGDELSKLPMTDALQALNGKVAGLQITQAQGSPGAEVKVRVRGGISITQSNEPLYIVDGFPSPDGLRVLDPSDIGSIDVLKDASATAIYGAAGANGVILITTKSGAEGKASISFDSYIGIKKISKRLGVLKPLDFVKLEYERAMLDGGMDESRKFTERYGLGWNEKESILANMQNSWSDLPTAYGNRAGINWQDEIFDSRTPISQNYKFSVNGGNKDTKYNVSFSHTDDDGVMKGSGYEKNNIRLRFDQKLSKKLSFSASVGYVWDKTEGMGSLNEGGRFSRMQHIIQYRPVISRDGNDKDLLSMDIDPILDNDSGNVMVNPNTSIVEEKRKIDNKFLNLNASLTYKILPNLIYRGMVGMGRRDMSNDIFFGARSSQAQRSGGPYAELRKSDRDNWTYSNTLTYSPKIDKNHKLDIMIGQEETYRRDKSLFMGVRGFGDDNFELNDLSLGKFADVPTNSIADARQVSFFSRINYNLFSKYLFIFTIRSDGSSKFGSDNKWGVFPSGSFAWRLSEEIFIKRLKVFSDLKLRIGIGTAGNNNISNYLSLMKMGSSYMPENGSQENSYYEQQLANRNLKWETDISANIGLDMGFLNQRLQVSLDIYRNEASDLLLNKNLPLISGFSTMISNVGKTRNTGFEMSITSYNIDRECFTWNSTVNLATNKNKVIKLADASVMPVRSKWSSDEWNGYDYMVREGEPVGQMWGYVNEGIYTVDDFDFNPNADSEDGLYTLKKGIVGPKDGNVRPGYWKYKDLNGDGIIDGSDEKIIGKAHPKIYGGITNDFTFKGFDLTFVLNYSIGGKVYNANKMFYTMTKNRYKNALDDVLHRFTYIDKNGVNVYDNPDALRELNSHNTYGSLHGTQNLQFSSKFVEGASYLRLSNITLGYTVPKKLLRKIGIQRLRFYASINNLFTITGYSGFDPEVDTRSNGGLTPNIDWGAYPRAMTTLFGLNLTL